MRDEDGLRGVRVKGGKTMDVPLPSMVMQFLATYVERVLSEHVDRVRPDTPLFWSRWGRRRDGLVHAPMTGKNIWRLVKVYGRIIRCPELKPRHGVAMEMQAQEPLRDLARQLTNGSR